MNEPATIWAVIAGMALANIAIRGIPIAVVSRAKLPEPVTRWLSFVPAAVMSAIVAVEVLRPQGAWVPLARNAYLFAAVPTALIFARWRSFLGATVAGMASFLAFRALLG